MITEPTSASVARSEPARGWLALFRAAPPIPVTITNPAEISANYRRWRLRILFFTTFGYAMFYFVRKNLPFAMPSLIKELNIDTEVLGIFLTLHGVIYGISKFTNGLLADRANAKVFMSTALVASALLNIIFGFSTITVAFGIIWMLNGWAQGMGFPPCARLIANWFPPKELATKFSIWNSSHNIGSILIILLCGFLVSGKYFPANWRLCFFVPAAMALVAAVVLWFKLADTPPSVGLPEAASGEEAVKAPETGEEFKAFVRKKVFGNGYTWLLASANFFVYAIRYAVFDWSAVMLKGAKNIEVLHASWMVAGFEVFGLIGALLGGWITDRFLGGRAARACVVYMALAGVSLLLFWKIPNQSELLTTGLLCATGFFVYGPQCLLAIACANLATKRAAATAIGLTSIFGYASTTLSGWGFGRLIKFYGWDAGFGILLGCAAIGTILFAIVWPAQAHGYGEQIKR